MYSNRNVFHRTHQQTLALYNRLQMCESNGAKMDREEAKRHIEYYTKYGKKAEDERDRNNSSGR